MPPPGEIAATTLNEPFTSLAREQGSTEGFRVIINTGRVGRQEVYHLHVHVIGGPDALGPMLKRN